MEIFSSNSSFFFFQLQRLKEKKEQVAALTKEKADLSKVSTWTLFNLIFAHFWWI
jgi:adenosine deaminase